MSRDAFDLAAGLVRAWTSVYTWTVSPDVRERRRGEIEADLWDAAHDDTRDRSGLLLLLRAIGGLADDIRWSFEQPQHTASLASALVAMATIALGGWLVASYTLRIADMPTPGVAPAFATRLSTRRPGPPPLPPPPPCLPAGMAGSPTPCTR